MLSCMFVQVVRIVLWAALDSQLSGRFTQENTTGYEQIVFAGKKAQAAKVETLISCVIACYISNSKYWSDGDASTEEKGFLPPELVHNVRDYIYIGS